VRRCVVITLSNQSSKIRPALKTHPTFEKTRKELKALSDKELLSDLQKLNQRERRLKVLVLLYLSEIETRKLYLPLGYSSLFDFCTSRLRYTRATAARRIRSARAAARYPEALAMLLSGEINITTLAMVNDILDQSNHEEILSEISGRSTRQVELLVSRHKPVRLFRDTVRPVCVMRRVEESPAACGRTETDTSDPSAGTGVPSQDSSPSAETNYANQNAALGEEHSTVTGDSSPSAETNPTNRGGQVSDGSTDLSNKSSPSAETKGDLPGQVILEQRLKLGFTVSPAFMKKYNKIKSLLSSRHPEGINFEMLFDTLMNEYLEKHDPDKRRERRMKRAKNRDKTAKQDPEKRHERRATHVTKPDKPAKQDLVKHSSQETERAGKRDKALKDNSRKKSRDSRSNSRYIPPAVRDQVYARDKGRCTFMGANGKRCGATWDLEIDHVIPFARGGDNSPGNLRLLCRKHNYYQAERVYGRGFMKNYIKIE
jgi:5-methylcytosine-specific restriction endonuclease McrA